MTIHLVQSSSHLSSPLAPVPAASKTETSHIHVSPPAENQTSLDTTVHLPQVGSSIHTLPIHEGDVSHSSETHKPSTDAEDSGPTAAWGAAIGVTGALLMKGLSPKALVVGAVVGAGVGALGGVYHDIRVEEAAKKSAEKVAP